MMTRKDIAERYDTVITDVDGTLYRLFPVRARMGLMMTGNMLLHPGMFPLYRALLYFRKIRKSPGYINAGMRQQIQVCADRYGLSYESTSAYIDKWLFDKPLEIIPAYRYIAVLEFLRECSEQGKKIVVYSDYPAAEKTEVLGLRYDFLFYPGHGIPEKLKPSVEVMETILRSIVTEPGRVLFIGDDDEKDGGSAELAGIDYVNIRTIIKIISDPV